MVLLVIQSDELTTDGVTATPGPDAIPLDDVIRPGIEGGATPEGKGIAVAPEELEELAGPDVPPDGGVILNAFDDMINLVLKYSETRYQVRISTYYK